MSRIIDEATLKGYVIDTIDEAFYPVTSAGTPLKKGDYINLDGELIQSAPSDGKYGEIDLVDGKFVVKWNDQMVGFSENGTPQRQGKVFVKGSTELKKISSFSLKYIFLILHYYQDNLLKLFLKITFFQLPKGLSP